MLMFVRSATFLMLTRPLSRLYWRSLAKTVLMTPTRTQFSGTIYILI